MNHMNNRIAVLLLGGIGLLASCSDDHLTHRPGTPNVEQSGVEVNNDVAALAGRVEMYSVPDRYVAYPWEQSAMYSTRTRALAQPPVPGDAKDMSVSDFNPRNPSGNNFVLPEGVEAEFNLNLNGANFYVNGSMTLRNVTGTGRIYVLNGGSLSYPDHLAAKVEIYTYVGGKFSFRGNDFSTERESVFHTLEDLSVPGSLNSQGVFNVDGELNVGGELTIHNGGLSNVIVGLNVGTKTSVSNGMLYVQGPLVSPEFTASAGAYIFSTCKGIYEKSLSLTGNTVYYATSYVKSAVTTVGSGAALTMNGTGLLDLGNLKVTGGASVEVSGEEYAVVNAMGIEVDRTDLRNVFKGNMGLHYKGDIKGVEDQSKLEFLANVKINGEDDTRLEESECTPGYTPAAPDDDKNGVDIDHIAQITSPQEHDHYLSATCVQSANGNIYVSYHTNGAEYDGCAEVFRFGSNNEISLISYMRPTEARDFNHLIVDNGNVFLTGGDRKGGFLAYLPLGANGVYQGGESSMSFVRLDAGDANCVVRNGNYYQVAASNGFHTINATDMTLAGLKETEGSAKYISLGSDKFVALNLASRNEEQAGAVITTYGLNDYTFSNAQTQLTDAVITPANGKNVCLSDGENIYVALGGNGLRCYTGGAANGEFRLNGKARVNGLDYDDTYIYVAYGEKGLRILDKQTLKEVASYTHSGGKSANFVKVVDGYIFVAYGLNGLQVFRLTER